VASPAPTFTQVIDHGTNGYLADAAEWPEVFRFALERSSEDRSALNTAALKVVKNRYRGKAVAPRIDEALTRLSS